MRVVAAGLVFVATAVCLALGLGMILGGLSPAKALASLLGGAAAGCFAFFGTRKAPSQPLTVPDLFMLTVFVLASARAFLWLLYPSGADWKVLSPNNLGDIALHLQLIQFLASGCPLWPETPFFAGTPLTYYLGVDLFNSLLMLVGVPLTKGLVWVGLLGAAAAGWALWNWGRAFTLAGLLFNGGLAGFALFTTGHLEDFQGDLAWKNLFLAVFVTQPALLFALPAGLVLLADWRVRFGDDEGSDRGPLLPVWVLGLLYAVMPLFSAQTFLALSVSLAALFLFLPKKRLLLVRFVGAAFPVATASAWLVTDGFSMQTGIRWLPGWMQGSDGVWFWMLNFGIALPLLGVLAWRLVFDREHDASTRALTGSGLFLLITCALFAFAPWPWDNVKIMIWGWLIVLPFLWEGVLAHWGEILCGLCLVALFFSGAVSLVGGLDARHGYRLIGRLELEQARRDLASIPPHDVLATTPEYNNPAILLGHPVLCGYEGHLWSHGIAYQSRMQALQRILAQEPGWENTAQALDARWLYLPPNPPQPIPRKSLPP